VSLLHFDIKFGNIFVYNDAVSRKRNNRLIRTINTVLKLTETARMVVTCIMLLFLLVSSNVVSAWISWYASTHHDFNITPGAGDSNEIIHQTDSTTSIPGRSTFEFSFLTRQWTVMNSGRSQRIRLSARPVTSGKIFQFNFTSLFSTQQMTSSKFEK
jgi:hypothetical protein